MDGMTIEQLSGGRPRRGTRPHLGPLALTLLLVGLAVAIAADGQLPAAWSRALFGVLLVLDLIVVEWLTRSQSVPSRRA